MSRTSVDVDLKFGSACDVGSVRMASLQVAGTEEIATAHVPSCCLVSAPARGDVATAQSHCTC